MHADIGKKLLDLFETNHDNYLQSVLDACGALNMDTTTTQKINQGILFNSNLSI